MNLAGIDLNLFLVLHTVLEEKSATKAAARLNVTQSAVSNALARLRDALGDPLVVRRSGGLVATPRAVEIAPHIAAAIASLSRATEGGDFAPATTTRRFGIACTDVVEVILLPSLVGLFRRRMPKASLLLCTPPQLDARGGLGGGDIDLFVGIPPELPAGWQEEAAYDDDMVCVVRRRHPMVRKKLDLDTYASLPHVEVALFREPQTRVDAALSKVGRARRVAVIVPHFASVPLAVAHSDAIATVPRRLASTFARAFDIRLLEPPVKLPHLMVRQFWHARTAADPGTRMLRQLVRDAASATG